MSSGLDKIIQMEIYPVNFNCSSKNEEIPAFLFFRKI